MRGIRLGEFYWLLKRALIHEGSLNFCNHLSKGEILTKYMYASLQSDSQLQCVRGYEIEHQGRHINTSAGTSTTPNATSEMPIRFHHVLTQCDFISPNRWPLVSTMSHATPCLRLPNDLYFRVTKLVPFVPLMASAFISHTQRHTLWNSKLCNFSILLLLHFPMQIFNAISYF
jgi:hypothetical protein